MKAIVISKPGKADVLQLKEVPRPVPGKGELLVKIKATGVNRADLIQRLGHYPPPADVPQDILGLEFSGIVERLGDGVDRFSPGDRVYGLAGGGTYAEYLVVNAGA